MKYLYLLQQALIWIITIYWAYQIVVSFCSLIKLKDKNLLQIVDGTQIRNLLSTIHEYNYVEREKRSAVLKEERDKIRKGENDFEI